MTITLVAYDPNWSKEFEKEKEKLQHAFDDIVVAIEHVGRTAKPGMYSKPIIDILIGVKDLTQVHDEHIHLITSLGYQYIQAYEKQLPHRRFFLKNDTAQNRTHHIHLVNYSSAWWQRHILFRDYLRENPNDAKEYETLKLKLATTLNESPSNNEKEKYFYLNHIKPYPQLAEEYQKLRTTLGSDFTIGNQYALAKSALIQSINTKAYFDFDLHQPDVVINQLNGYIPQLACFEIYKKMFQDPDFIRCYGVALSDERIHQILEKNINDWDQYGFGPYVWFDQVTQEFVGEGGLSHTVAVERGAIELTYALSKKFWGRGLAATIGRFALDYGFNTLNLSNIVCFTMTTNHQSLRVIEKLGFKYEKDFIYKTLPHKLFRFSQHTQQR